MSYEIGYKRPPKSGQFRKGQSGNPKGRPKSSRNFMTLLEEELDQPVTINENGKKKTISRMQAMTKRMVVEALQGDRKAFLTLFEVLRRTGQLEKTEIDAYLPENYESILDEYVAKRHKSLGKSSTKGEKS